MAENGDPEAAHRAATLRVWPELAASAGLSPDGWSDRLLHLRRDGRLVRSVTRFERNWRSVIVKHERPAGRRASFAAEIEAHAAAHRAVGADPVCRIPALLAHRPDLGAALFEDTGAPTLDATLAEASFDAQLEALARAGVWLDAFHRARLGERRTFRPKANADFLRKVCDDVRDVHRQVPAPSDFLAAAEACLRLAEGTVYRGRETVAAELHGDLNLRNLMIGRDAVWGVDFMPGHHAPVGHDIARLLVHYAALHAPLDRLTPGEVLPKEAAEAFFSEYRVVGPDDPSVGFLLRYRILADWSRIESGPDGLSIHAARRLQGLQALARSAFGTR